MTPSMQSGDAKLQPFVRVVLAIIGGLGLLLLGTARQLEPDPRGFGTHEQLGLTPCFFQAWSGNSCPTCGMTTAWAYATRGQVEQAAAVNLGGALLAGVVLIAAPWLLASAVVGSWLLVRPTLPMLLTICTSWLLITLLDWFRRWPIG